MNIIHFSDISTVSASTMTVDLNSLKLSPMDEGPKKERMNPLRDSLRQRKNVLTGFVRTSEKPGMYPDNLKKSIQNAGLVESMTDAKQTIIMQEFQIYVLGIEDSVKKK